MEIGPSSSSSQLNESKNKAVRTKEDNSDDMMEQDVVKVMASMCLMRLAQQQRGLSTVFNHEIIVSSASAFAVAATGVGRNFANQALGLKKEAKEETIGWPHCHVWNELAPTFMMVSEWQTEAKVGEYLQGMTPLELPSLGCSLFNQILSQVKYLERRIQSLLDDKK